MRVTAGATPNSPARPLGSVSNNDRPLDIETSIYPTSKAVTGGSRLISTGGPGGMLLMRHAATCVAARLGDSPQIPQSSETFVSMISRCTAVTFWIPPATGNPGTRLKRQGDRRLVWRGCSPKQPRHERSLSRPAARRQEELRPAVSFDR